MSTDNKKMKKLDPEMVNQLQKKQLFVSNLIKMLSLSRSCYIGDRELLTWILRHKFHLELKISPRRNIMTLRPIDGGVLVGNKK